MKPGPSNGQAIAMNGAIVAAARHNPPSRACHTVRNSSRRSAAYICHQTTSKETPTQNTDHATWRFSRR